MIEEAMRVQKGMEELGLSGTLLADPDTICYVSGAVLGTRLWAGPCFSGGPPLLALGLDARPPVLLLANTEGVRETEENAVLVSRYGAFDIESAHDPASAWKEALLDTSRDLFGPEPRLRLGVDRTVPHAAVAALRQQHPGLETVDIAPLLSTGRRLKTTREVARLREACRVNDIGQAALAAHITPGVSEIELWQAVNGAMAAAVASEIRVSGELVSGPRTAVVNYPGGPTTRRLAAGDTIIMDLSVQVDGYWSDTTNTLVVGRAPDARQATCCRAALGAFSVGFDLMRHGMPCVVLEREVRGTLKRLGFDPPHYLGHQIGASVNERPRLVSHDPDIIEAGMVFALEPGAYEGPTGRTGARVEKNILVTSNGPEALSQFPWGFPN
jgi:Xaa-Pro aminopeptidase